MDFFLHKTNYFLNSWPFSGFLAIVPPFQSLDHSEIEILALWAIKSRYKQLLLNKLFDSSTGNPSNGLKMALKWPPRVQKWPKFAETLESQKAHISPTISKNWLKRSKNDKMGA